MTGSVVYGTSERKGISFPLFSRKEIKAIKTKRIFPFLYLAEKKSNRTEIKTKMTNFVSGINRKEIKIVKAKRKLKKKKKNRMETKTK